MATINPLGDSLDLYIENLLAGKSGIVFWKSLDTSLLECKSGGDLGDYDCQSALEKMAPIIGEARFKLLRKLFRSAPFSAKTATICSLRAWENAGLFDTEIDSYLTSMNVAGHNLNSKYLNDATQRYYEDPESIPPLAAIQTIDPSVPGMATEALQLHGPSATIGGACASGNLALRAGCHDIMSGECERSIIVGALFDVSSLDIFTSEYVGMLSVKKEFQAHPERLSRPFDQKRNGFVYSHGVGVVVIEELEVALQRGARVYAEVLGVRANSNANHMPRPDAGLQSRLMTELLHASGVHAEEVDYINCHATGTPVGDLEEIRAIKKSFGTHSKKLKLNAPKSMLGHVCWSSPIVEMIGGILQMQRGWLHPSINIDELDPEIDMDVCANHAVKYPARMMLNNAFGFAGINCCSLIRLYDE